MATKRLTLRPPTFDDAPAIADLAQDWEIVSMTSRMPWPYTQDDALSWVVNESDGETTFAVTHRQTLIGITGYLSDGEGSAEIGYWLGRPYWGQGFATEAAGALIAYAFRNDACERLTCGHFLDNPASARVIEKLGFVLVGQEDCWCEARKREVPAMRYELPRPRALKTLGQSLANFWSRA